MSRSSVKVRPFKATKTPWTMADITALRDWHDARMKELNYPREVALELTGYREKFISKLGRWIQK